MVLTVTLMAADVTQSKYCGTQVSHIEALMVAVTRTLARLLASPHREAFAPKHWQNIVKHELTALQVDDATTGGNIVACAIGWHVPLKVLLMSIDSFAENAKSHIDEMFATLKLPVASIGEDVFVVYAWAIVEHAPKVQLVNSTVVGSRTVQRAY